MLARIGLSKSAKVYLFALVAAIAIIAGCGGGGGSSASGGGSNGGTLLETRAEAIFQGSLTPMDPTNLQTGDLVRFVVASYFSDGTRTQSTPSGWSTTDASSSVGVLDSSTGNFNATSASATTFHASINFGGTPLSIDYKVSPQIARINGSVLDAVLGTGVRKVQINYYDAGGNVVGSTTTGFDGSYWASVPTTAVSFNLVGSSIDATAYYKVYLYNAFRYAATIETCTADLPALSNGLTTHLANVTLEPSNSVPPGPPDGCH